MYVFFFKQKTAYELRISDWSSDVCSSDLIEQAHFVGNGADDPLIVANLGVDIGRGRTDREPLDHSGAQFQFGTLDARLGDIDQAIQRIEERIDDLGAQLLVLV